VKTAPLLATLVAVTALAAALRLTAPDHGLPSDAEPDIYTVRHVERLREEGLGDRYLAGWKYPLLVGAVTAALPWSADGPDADAPLDRHLHAAGASIRWTRYVSVTLAILAAPLTLLLALRFLGPGGAVLASLFVATSGLHTWMSVQARPHAPTAALVVLAVLASARWIERGRARDALLAGIAAGLSGAALHSGLVGGLAFGAAAVCVLARRRAASLPSVALAGAIALGLVVWAYGLEPHEPRDWHVRETEYLERVGADDDHVAFGGHLMRSDMFNGRGFLALLDAFRRLDPVLGLLATLGLVAALARLAVRRTLDAVDRSALITTAAAAVPFLAVFGLYELTYDRFFLPLYPVFAVLAALACVRASERVGLRGRTGRVLASAAVLALPLATSGRIAWLVARPTTHDLVHAAVAGEGAAPALLVDVPPLHDWTDEALALRVPPTHPNRWLTYQARRLAEWGSLPPGLAATPSFADPPPGAAAALARVRAATDEAARAGAEEAAAEAVADHLRASAYRTVVLSTTWHNEPAAALREPALAAWRSGLRAAGFELTGTIAPIPGDDAPREGTVAEPALPRLLRRRALGDRCEVWTR